MLPEYQLDATNKLAILPMWVIHRIKEEMRLGPAAWQAITDAVEQAEVPQALTCEVKLPPGTVIGQGSPLSTLLMAIAQRASQPAHALVFCSEPPAPQPHTARYRPGQRCPLPQQDAPPLPAGLREASEGGRGVCVWP